MARKNYVAIPPKPLKTDVLSTDSTFKLRDIVWYTGSDGVAVNLAASDFGSDNVGYGVFEPKTAREEWFTFSSANMATAVTGGLTITLRGLIRTAPYTTEATARKFNHESGSQVLLYTNSPAFYDDFANKDNDEVITGQWQLPTGANYPTIGATYSAPTADNAAAPKKYVDDTAAFGAPAATNSTAGIDKIAATTQTIAGTNDDGTHTYVIPVGLTKTTSAGAGDQGKVPLLGSAGVLSQTFLDSARTWGAVQSFTADNVQITSDANSANDAVRFSQVQSLVGATSAFTTGAAIDGSTTPQVVCIKASDGLLYKADANDSTLTLAIGFVNTNALITTTPTLVTHGFIGGFTGLTQNATYYVSDTAGAISATQSTTCAIPVGRAVSTTTLQISLGKRVATGTIAHSAAAAGTQDVTTTIGFKPTKILLGVTASIVGSTDNGEARGIMSYYGTTLCGIGSVREDGNATAITSSNAVGSITNSVATGGISTQSTGGNKASLVVSVNSVSATGFVTRFVNSTDAGAGGNSSGTLYFIAEE